MVTMVLLKVAWICTMPVWTTRFSFFLKLFFLPAFAGALAAFAGFAVALAILCLARRLLLIGHRSAARSLARACVGMRSLAANRQPAAMPQAAVGTHLDVPLDVHRDFLAEIALHRALFFQNGAHAIDFFFRQIADLLVEIDAGPIQERTGTGTADSVNVREPDFGPLRYWQIHTG